MPLQAARVRAARVATIVAVSLLVALVLVSGVATVAPTVPVAAREAILTVFTGSATVSRAASSGVTAAARTGDRLADGDTVATAADSKAGLLFPDGSVTRLDSETTVQVHVTRAAGGGVVTELAQSAGLTWNRVRQLVGGSRFHVTGPNTASVEVRGTEFGYYVEHDAAGNPVIWVDTWAGTVQVSGAVGPPVTAVTGQRVTVRPNAAPTVPAPIPATDLQLSFTVFNEAVNAVTGTPVGFANGTLSTGGTASAGSVVADGRSDLQAVLAWPGSTYQLSVFDPAGALVAQRSSSTPPLSVALSAPRAGRWSFAVADLGSSPNEAWWVVVARSARTGG